MRTQLTASDRSAYRAAYYAAHREEFAAAQRAYREGHREEVAAQRAAYNAAHREEIASYGAFWYAAHREEIAARNAARREERAAVKAAYNATHREQIAAYDAAYRATHREQVNAKISARRARLRGLPSERVMLSVLFERDKGICGICQKRVYKNARDIQMRPSHDHILPVSRGGANTYVNARLAHRRCNTARGNRGSAQLGLV